ncbi:hypothetical protein C4587_01920 [Candidatus Parcubacteria bacterium]|nr:MAG: hypothetical protein C4587_01920 [Candidatus Parcubacteria bacterium]
MFTFYVYEHKKVRTSFRVVLGEHKQHRGAEDYTIRAYQGATKQLAVDAAYSGETRNDIREQIARFNPTITRPGKHSAGAEEVTYLDGFVSVDNTMPHYRCDNKNQHFYASSVLGWDVIRRAQRTIGRGRTARVIIAWVPVPIDTAYRISDFFPCVAGTVKLYEGDIK